MPVLQLGVCPDSTLRHRTARVSTAGPRCPTQQPAALSAPGERTGAEVLPAERGPWKAPGDDLLAPRNSGQKAKSGNPIRQSNKLSMNALNACCTNCCTWWVGGLLQ